MQLDLNSFHLNKWVHVDHTQVGLEPKKEALRHSDHMGHFQSPDQLHLDAQGLDLKEKRPSNFVPQVGLNLFQMELNTEASLEKVPNMVTAFNSGRRELMTANGTTSCYMVGSLDFDDAYLMLNLFSCCVLLFSNCCIFYGSFEAAATTSICFAGCPLPSD